MVSNTKNHPQPAWLHTFFIHQLWERALLCLCQYYLGMTEDEIHEWRAFAVAHQKKLSLSDKAVNVEVHCLHWWHSTDTMSEVSGWCVHMVVARSWLRSTDHGDLVVPRALTTRSGSRSFRIAGPSTWNGLPLNIRSASTREEFKRSLKS